MSRSRRSKVIAGLLVVLLVAAIGAAWHFLRPVPYEVPDTVAPAELEQALRAQPDLPLSAQETDVLVIAGCTVRRDRLEPYGHPLPTTPFLDQLAATGVLFEHNFSQAPWTRPAMGAIFSGRWPRVLGLDPPGRGDNFDMVVEAEHVLLAEMLKDAGYATIGSVANPNLKEVFGFRQGFDDYREPDGIYRERPTIPTSHDIVDDILEMAAAVPADQRLYARAVVLDGHVRRRYDAHYLRHFTGQHRDSRIDRDLARYDAALRTIDAQLARLIVELRKTRPNLLVVFAADHGEGLRLPESHGREHGNHVFRSTVETPLIVHHPALPSRGLRISELSMNVDIVPTVLELLGLEPPGPVDGRSQAPAILGGDHEPVHEVIFAETFFRRVHKSTAFDGRHQLIRIYNSDRSATAYTDALFSVDDPAAAEPLNTDMPASMRTLAAQLTAWETLLASLAGDAAKEERGEVDPATRQMLRDLGYLEDTPGIEDTEDTPGAGADDGPLPPQGAPE
jgi:arylsulfatase A-like enzyme